jgi:hypothetical protein
MMSVYTEENAKNVSRKDARRKEDEEVSIPKIQPGKNIIPKGNLKFDVERLSLSRSSFGCATL